jgi:hypothetical protein
MEVTFINCIFVSRAVKTDSVSGAVIINSLLLKNKTRDLKERNIRNDRKLHLNNKLWNPKEENIRKGERLQKDL